MSNETKGQDENLDLQAILKKAEQQTSFPDVPLDEFEPPTYDEWKEACVALLKGAPFEKKMFTKTYEGITFEPMYTHKMTEIIIAPKIPVSMVLIPAIIFRPVPAADSEISTP